MLDEVLRFPEVTHINFDPILKGSSSRNGGLLFLIQLNSWFPLFFFSAPNGHPEINDVKVEAIEEAVLSVDSFNRTITFTSDIDIDQIPKPLDRITIGIRDQNSLNEDKVHFVLPSSSSPTAANHDADEVNGVPTILQKAVSFRFFKKLSIVWLTVFPLLNCSDSESDGRVKRSSGATVFDVKRFFLGKP